MEQVSHLATQPLKPLLFWAAEAKYLLRQVHSQSLPVLRQSKSLLLVVEVVVVVEVAEWQGAARAGLLFHI
jgi:hypothetical protein